MRVGAAAIGIVVSVVLCALLTTAAVGAGAKAKPDLYVAAAKATSSPAKVTATLANRGRACARASKTSFFASADAKRSRSDKLLAKRATRRLCKKAKQTTALSFDVAALPTTL